MRSYASVCIVILLLVAAPTMAKKAVREGELVQRINQDVRTVLRSTETPGATILAIRDGQLLFEHSYGSRKLDGRLPASMDTHYEIGSITKQFTAAAILQLQDAGKLNI